MGNQIIDGPMLLFNSTDEMVPFHGMVLMQQAMMAQGVPCIINLLEGTEHGSEYVQSALPRTIQFFRDLFYPQGLTLSKINQVEPDRLPSRIASDHLDGSE